MARAIIFGSLCIILGAGLGWVLKPSGHQPVRAQTEEKQTQVKTVTRTIVKTVKPDGTVVIKEIAKERDEAKSLTKTKPLPRLDYRLGIASGLDLRYIVTAGRRLVGNLWLDASFKPSTKDATIGLSYEF